MSPINQGLRPNLFKFVVTWLFSKAIRLVMHRVEFQFRLRNWLRKPSFDKYRKMHLIIHKELYLTLQNILFILQFYKEISFQNYKRFYISFSCFKNPVGLKNRNNVKTPVKELPLSWVKLGLVSNERSGNSHSVEIFMNFKIS